MNELAIEKLEFAEIRELLASHCATSLGKRLARSLQPTTKGTLIRQWLDQVREMLAVAEDVPYPPMGGIRDIVGTVRATTSPTPLEADALACVAETLLATAQLRAWFVKLGDIFPKLSRLGERIDDLSPIGQAIDEAIDPRGQVRDYASPKLANIRATIEETRGRIKATFDRILRQAKITKMLQYSGATFHGDRMVLPLKSEYRGRIPGIVHRSSDSGMTLFVEPSESVQLNNSIVQLREAEGKEITQILRGLTQRVRLNAEAILSTLRVIAVVDLIAAKCRYAKKRSCVCPVISDDGTLDLHGARHPILLELFDADSDPTNHDTPREVVPIDIRLGDDFDILIVTGPNTGGKTVAIKTLGLIALMTQCGIPIPASEGSRMPAFDHIHIDVGDEQSLQQSLSTFSSHLSTILGLLKRSGPRSLVLIDELGAGTDPDEGAAIGRAVISELLTLQVKAVITTHLSSLKAVAFTTARVDNGSVEFDTESLKPTYRLRIGEPGNSNALIIAERLGMPARIIAHAKTHLADATQALNKAIAGTLDSRRQAEEARKQAREALIDAHRERDRCKQEQLVLKNSQEAFDRWAQWVNDLEPGDDVYIKSLKRPGKIVRMQVQQQKALVSAGAFEIEVAFRDIDSSEDGKNP